MVKLAEQANSSYSLIVKRESFWGQILCPRFAL
jgi:hypothetical protein